MEGTENQLTAAREQVKVAQEQLNTTNVYSDVDGIADQVWKRAKTFNGMNQIKIVNNSQLKVAGMYRRTINLHSFRKPGGSIYPRCQQRNNDFPWSASVDRPDNRGFIAEARIPPILCWSPTSLPLSRSWIMLRPMPLSYRWMWCRPMNPANMASWKPRGINRWPKRNPLSSREALWGMGGNGEVGLNAGEQLITEAPKPTEEGQHQGTGTK